jgi:arylsulfatase A-like enzyme
MIVRYPGHVPAGRDLFGYSESIDLPTTILDMAGRSEEDRDRALPRSPGRSLWDYLCGGAAIRQSAYAEMDDRPGADLRWRMLVRDNWKYVNWPARGDMFVNLSEDPSESRNLADEPDEPDKE